MKFIIAKKTYICQIIKYAKKNCYNKLQEISFTYNFDHVLLYIMWKCHAFINVLLLSIDLTFLLKVHPPKWRFWAKFGPESFSNCFRCLVWSISIIKEDLRFIYATTAKIQIFVWPTITNLAFPLSAMFRTSLHYFFLA